MPIVKADEALPQQPPIMLYYGEPGVCKTTLANTSEAPLLIDFDRGAKRSKLRKDVLVVNSWEDVVQEEAAGTLKGYRTIIIDTAKACLDDFLMDFVVRQDYQFRKNKLKAYGEIGDIFKLFINQRRNEQVNIVIIAHAKKDEDTKKFIPDVTGQSYALLLRIADQVGYISIENGKRVIAWEPSDSIVGKNVACLEKTYIPDIADPAFKDFNAQLIEKVRTSITALTEQQELAMKQAEAYQADIASCETPEDLTAALEHVNVLPVYLKEPLRLLIRDKRDEKGWITSEDKKGFTLKPSAEPAGEEGTDEPLTIESVLLALGGCNSIEQVSDLYMLHTDFIEASPVLEQAFLEATAVINGTAGESGQNGQEAGIPVTIQPELMPAPKKVDPKVFRKKYKNNVEVREALALATDVKDTANLYYINAEIVEADKELKGEFTRMKDKLFANSEEGLRAKKSSNGKA